MRKIVIPVSCLIVIALMFLSVYYFHNKKGKDKPVSVIQNKSEMDILNRSSELIRNNKPEEAENLLLNELEQGLDNYMMYYNLGVSYMNQGKYKLAVEMFSKSLLFIDTKAVYINRAYCYKTLGNIDKAIEDYSHIIKKYPSYKRAFIECGNLYLLLGNKEKAKLDFLKAKQNGFIQAEVLLKTL